MNYFKGKWKRHFLKNNSELENISMTVLSDCLKH